MKTTLWTQHQRHLHLFSIISAPCKVHFILVQTADCGSSLTNVEVCYRRTQNIAQIWSRWWRWKASAQSTPPSSSTERFLHFISALLLLCFQPLRHRIAVQVFCGMSVCTCLCFHAVCERNNETQYHHVAHDIKLHWQFHKWRSLDNISGPTRGI